MSLVCRRNMLSKFLYFSFSEAHATLGADQVGIKRSLTLCLHVTTTLDLGGLQFNVRVNTRREHVTTAGRWADGAMPTGTGRGTFLVKHLAFRLPADSRRSLVGSKWSWSHSTTGDRFLHREGVLLHRWWLLLLSNCLFIGSTHHLELWLDLHSCLCCRPGSELRPQVGRVLLLLLLEWDVVVDLIVCRWADVVLTRSSTLWVPQSTVCGDNTLQLTLHFSLLRILWSLAIVSVESIIPLYWWSVHPLWPVGDLPQVAQPRARERRIG